MKARLETRRITVNGLPIFTRIGAVPSPPAGGPSWSRRWCSPDPPRRSLKTFGFTLADRIEEKLPLVPVPTLVVRGARDTIVPQTWAQEVARLLPRGRFIEIPGGPHCVNYSTPQAFALVVSTFLRQTAGI